VATAAVGEIVRFAFEQTELARLEVLCAVGHAVSQRVAEKAGAILEGILRDRLRLADRLTDAVMYSIVRSDRDQTEFI
jgi:ribosomal-protein-alanine N-acetyltransferase